MHNICHTKEFKECKLFNLVGNPYYYNYSNTTVRFNNHWGLMSFCCVIFVTAKVNTSPFCILLLQQHCMLLQQLVWCYTQHSIRSPQASISILLVMEQFDKPVLRCIIFLPCFACCRRESLVGGSLSIPALLHSHTEVELFYHI